MQEERPRRSIAQVSPSNYGGAFAFQSASICCFDIREKDLPRLRWAGPGVSSTWPFCYFWLPGVSVAVSFGLAAVASPLDGEGVVFSGGEVMGCGGSVGLIRS